MERELKFRGWDEKQKKMFDRSDCLNLMYRTEGWFIFDWNKFERTLNRTHDFARAYYGCRTLVKLMQFTGLTDINGVDIYEGDIVYDSSAHCKWVVYWCPESGSWGDQPTVPHSYGLYKSLEKCFTVVGNIYETPELARDIN